ncbi:hypothetical protein OUZ56_011420 [Daphnia magna]|uniref:Uncharacterized protein n=1 Tax=Daphnia magna TaxID=35525 RepID=A0ABQ9Z0B4_9CRUS|nr:hypothetical protein OUZ56_011420 [Daphnia magna]
MFLKWIQSIEEEDRLVSSNDLIPVVLNLGYSFIGTTQWSTETCQDEVIVNRLSKRSFNCLTSQKYDVIDVIDTELLISGHVLLTTPREGTHCIFFVSPTIVLEGFRFARIFLHSVVIVAVTEVKLSWITMLVTNLSSVLLCLFL